MADQEIINIIREIRESVLAKYRKGDSKPSSLHERAGITDIEELYRTRYVSGYVVPHDLYPNASFEAGWCPPENLPPVARWMGRSSSLTFKADDFSGLRLDLTTHIPDLGRNPLQIDFILNGTRIHSVTLIDTGWLELRLDATTATERQQPGRTNSLDINASRTWIPSLYDRSNDDGREMSIAVCNLELTF